ncbi:MAG: DUF2934 domain-containing protein [Oryzomonas sp.]
MATRAYELYEEQGRRDGQSVQDWDKAEREIRKADVKAEPEAKVAAKPEANAEAKPDTKEESQPVVKAEPKPEVKAEAKSDTKDEPPPETKAEPEPETKAEPKSEPKTPTDLTPGMIKRVHELYEELGRQDLQAVEDLEKAERENRKDDK